MKTKSFLLILLPVVFGLTSVHSMQAPTGTWSSTGSMNAARARHTATLLKNGKILVAGGWNGSTSVASAELYNPTTETWTNAASMTIGRCFHTATLLTDGRVLVVGDGGGTVVVYNPTNDQWSITGVMSDTRRVGHTATLLLDGKVLVTGGVSGVCDYPVGTAYNSAEVYDPSTGTWGITGNMTVARSWHTATLLPDGRVLVAGGGTAELYNPATGTWSVTGSMNHVRSKASATLLSDGKVLVAGGGTAEIYDPMTETWSDTGTMNSYYENRPMTLLPNGKVLVAGGESANYSPVNAAELYDPLTAIWNIIDGIGHSRRFHTMTMLPNGKVLVAGGQADLANTPSKSAELYDAGPVIVTAPTNVTISGPTTGMPNSTYTFTASVDPITATTPITYIWQATGQSPVTGVANLTDTVTFNWSGGGEKVITVTAANAGGMVSDTHMVNIYILMTGVIINGPTTGAVNMVYTFAATVSPPTATIPITYTWSPVPDSGQGTAVVTYTWVITGDQTITVTAENMGGTVSGTHVIAVGEQHCIYLPLILR